MRTSDRASSLTRQLLAFGRKQVLHPRQLNLNDVVTQMASLLPPVLGVDIDLVLDLDPELGAVKADSSQLEQIIMNLVFNARDALPKGGALTIRTQNTYLDETWIVSHPEVRSGRHVMLTVSDTGCGMDRETQSHIFEPFFTTKDRRVEGASRFPASLARAQLYRSTCRVLRELRKCWRCHEYCLDRSRASRPSWWWKTTMRCGA